MRPAFSTASVVRLAFALLPAACASDSHDRGFVASVTVLPPSASGSVGQSAMFAAAAYDIRGDLVTGRPIQWSSSHPDVASVLQDGRVTAEGVGVTAISATVDGVSGLSSVIVTAGADSQPLLPPAPSGAPPAPVPTTSPTGDVESVVLVPGNATVGVLGAAAFDAVLRDDKDQALSGRVIEWSVGDALLASVAPNGMSAVVNGLLAGATAVRATSEGVTGSAPLTISLAPGAAPAGWPNLPAGFRPLTDEPLTGPLARFWEILWNDEGLGTFVTDSAAPHSPGGVFQVRYPAGFGGGYAPATLVHNLGTVRNVFVGLWWKASANWQGHSSNVNKIEFLFPRDGNGDLYLAAYGTPGGPYELRVNLQLVRADPRGWLRPNVSPAHVTMGEWHRIEWLVQYNTPGSADGVVRWWLDGKLAGDYRDVLFTTSLLEWLKVSPTWGGMGGAKTQTDYFWYDHVFVAWR